MMYLRKKTAKNKVSLFSAKLTVIPLDGPKPLLNAALLLQDVLMWHADINICSWLELDTLW